MTANERLTLEEVEILACILQNSNSDFAKSVKQCADLMRENARMLSVLKYIHSGTFIREGCVGNYMQTIDYKGIRELIEPFIINPAKDE